MAKRKGAGRPKIEIDWAMFDKLCELQCTLDEISDFFNCSPDTIQRRCKQDKNTNFATYFKKKATAGKISLRRAQYLSAIGTKDRPGNVSMQIWLGKQILGQKEHPIENVEGENIVFNVNFGEANAD